MVKPHQAKTESRDTPPGEEQRDMLEDSEQRASEEQPKSFDERNLTDKVVNIPPTGPGKKPIKGLDPK